VETHVAVAFVGGESARAAADVETFLDVVLRTQIAELEAQHRSRKDAEPRAVRRAGVRAARKRRRVVRRAALYDDRELAVGPHRRSDQDRGGECHDDLPHVFLLGGWCPTGKAARHTRAVVDTVRMGKKSGLPATPPEKRPWAR